MPNGFKSWIYYIFPKRCAICDGVVSFRETVCEDCEKRIEPISGKICVRCGHTVKNCECKRFAYHFRGIASPFPNSGATKEGIYNYKIVKNIDAAEYFGKKMAEKVLELFPNVESDVVTAVPMSRRKRGVKGFDHAEILAKAVASELGVEYRRMLAKVKKNKEQHTLSAKERFSNVKGVYVARENNYKNVLLIDDIKTTGATIDECSRQLMLAGTENVYCSTAVITTCKED